MKPTSTPPPTRLRVIAWLSLGLATTAVCVAWLAWRQSAPRATIDLIGPLYSEAPLLGRTILRRVRRRIEGPSLLKTAGLDGATGKLEGGDLELLPQGDHPTLVLDGLARVNHVSVEIETPASGRLEAFWAVGNEVFSEAQRAVVMARPRRAFENLELDLAAAFGSPIRRFRLRIDLPGTKAPVVIRSITLSKVAHVPEKPPTGRVGKVALREETREAAALQGADWTTSSLRVSPGDHLVFGLARSPYNFLTTRVDVRFAAPDGKQWPIFTSRLDPSAPARWVEHRVDLSGVAGKTGRFVFAAQGGGTDADGLVFVSSPKVVPGGTAPIHPNLILVSLDTVGAAHVRRLLASGRARFFSRMRREGVAFENAHANASITHSSHASLLTGRFPLRTGTIWLNGGLGKCPTLASILRKNGYATIAVTGGVLLTAETGFAQGFELFREEGTLFKPPLTCADARTGFALALKHLSDRGERPFFLFLHSYDAHGPYYVNPDLSGSERAAGEGDETVAWNLGNARGRLRLPPAELASYLYRTTADGRILSLSGERVDRHLVDRIEHTYEGEIAYLDRELDQLFVALGKEGLLENSVIVVTADHGEAFLEHGLLQHGLLYEENLHVPLVLWGPGRLPPGAVFDARVSLVDVLPTVLEMLGLPEPTGLDGRSLVPLLHGQPWRARPSYAFTLDNGFAWYSGTGEKWILRTAMANENFGHGELFRLDRDPGESVDLLRNGGTVPAALRRFARSSFDRLPGLHLSLQGFAGEDVRLRLLGALDPADPLYAWDMELLEPRTGGGSRGAWVVRLGPHPGIALPALTPASPFSLEVQTARGQKLVFDVVPETLAGAQGELIKSGGREVRAWRATSEVGPASLMSPEQLKRVRALGYAP
jgi:arylsulfatase A-like enzyme